MNRSTFIPLHVKSDFSLGLGTASVKELTERARLLGYRTLALTDVDNLSAQVRFHEECRLRGIRPVTGIELRPGTMCRDSPGHRRGRMVLLARDRVGYGNLCRIVSQRRSGELLDKQNVLPSAIIPFTDGVMVLSDDVTVVEELIATETVPRERLGILLVRPSPKHEDKARQTAAARLRIPLVADLDVIFLRQQDHSLHLLQLSIRKGMPFTLASADEDAEPPERWLRSPAAADSLFRDVPDAIAESARIAEQCTVTLPFSLSPRSPASSGTDSVEELRNLCIVGKDLLYPPHLRKWSTAHHARMQEELASFEALGFTPFMLVVAEILAYCRRTGVLAAVRGSGVSSLVMHLLGGSPVDPLAEGLLFERFLHPGKSSWPDVDIDLPWHRRDGVIRWVYDRFGADRVAMVAAYHTFGYRSGLRDGLKALGYSAATVSRLARLLPPAEVGIEEIDFLEAADESVEMGAPTDVNSAPAELRKALSLVNRLVGHPRHVAVHPGGIVVSPQPFADLLPLERSPKGPVITQYDLISVAKLGLIKIDLLGNRCLSELEECLRMQGQKEPLLASIPHGDPATLAMIDRADTMGCFQLESPAMRSLLARLPIRKEDDLVAALALIRPGAAAGKVKSAFVSRARGEETGESTFGWMEDRLADTHGLFLYEEDIMVLLHRAGGIGLAKADELRSSIVSSGGDDTTLNRLKSGFMAAAERHGTDTLIAAEAWAIAERLAAYSFNKAHSASYGRLAYFSAYMKARHPLDFACALLNHHEGLYPLRVEAAELARKGIELRGPHVNLSWNRTARECDKGIRVGLDKIRGLSGRSIHSLLEVRSSRGPFSSVSNLIENVPLHWREVVALVMAGACDGIPPLTPEGYPFIHETFLERLEHGDTISAQASYTLSTSPDTDPEKLALYQGLVRVRNELRYLGMHLSAHPMKLLRSDAMRYGCSTVGEVVAATPDSAVRVAGTIAAMKRVPTRSGIMLFLTLEDETGLMEAVVLPSVYRQTGNRLTAPGPFLMAGTVRRRQESIHLEVFRLAPFYQRNRPFAL